MAVSPLFPPRPAVLVCACVLLASLARAEAPVPGAQPPPAPEVQAVSPGASAPAPVAPAPAATPQPFTGEHSGASLPPGMEEEPESLGWMLTRTLLLFGAVVASIYLTLNVGLRRLMGLQGVPMGRPSVVSVVERVPLDQRRTLFVLKAADEYLLVGGGEGGLQLLSKLDTEAVERIRSERPPSNVISLSPFLQKLLARRDATQPGATQPSGTQPPGA
ncbi:flagellar biosynthetic protein FliO [Vitiosangium sp. GDMCC 1.1324]|uniref:flagellar biosynthetic protein FliO n=1 Tax=Vitiosangium sp. (strain GDMCC 1.1324) TaxID=2138576 RepID=UPI000D3C4C33|nr:flagellar biosynthetic protein FliO [Vitiosangium sp. GDMCC 1.1324]PTL80507.1 flagellar biosynthesis protein FliO [Vitiosangium sp. GDMCC 1.1324]